MDGEPDAGTVSSVDGAPDMDAVPAAVCVPAEDDAPHAADEAIVPGTPDIFSPASPSVAGEESAVC